MFSVSPEELEHFSANSILRDHLDSNKAHLQEVLRCSVLNKMSLHSKNIFQRIQIYLSYFGDSQPESKCLPVLQQILYLNKSDLFFYIFI